MRANLRLIVTGSALIFLLGIGAITVGGALAQPGWPAATATTRPTRAAPAPPSGSTGVALTPTRKPPVPPVAPTLKPTNPPAFASNAPGGPPTATPESRPRTPSPDEAIGYVSAYQPGAAITVGSAADGRSALTFRIDGRTRIEFDDPSRRSGEIQIGDWVVIRGREASDGNGYVVRIIEVRVSPYPSGGPVPRGGPAQSLPPVFPPGGSPAPSSMPTRGTPSPQPSAPTSTQAPIVPTRDMP